MNKKEMTRLLVGIFITATISPVSVYAFGQDRGGGDDVGLEFQSSFISALRTIQSKDAGLAKKIHDLDSTSALVGAHILVVDTDLKVTVRDITQNSVATNEPSTNTILINRSRWNAITDPKIKQGIALHEVLSLSKIEWTGQYPISGQFVAYSGLKLDVLNNGGLKYDSPYDRIQSSALNSGEQKRCQALVAQANVQQAINSARTSMDELMNSCKAQYSSLEEAFQAHQRLNAQTDSASSTLAQISTCLVTLNRSSSLTKKVENDLLETSIAYNRCAIAVTGIRP